MSITLQSVRAIPEWILLEGITAVFPGVIVMDSPSMVSLNSPSITWLICS